MHVTHHLSYRYWLWMAVERWFFLDLKLDGQSYILTVNWMKHCHIILYASFHSKYWLGIYSWDYHDPLSTHSLPPPTPLSFSPSPRSFRGSLYFAQREVSFINSLSVEIVSYIIGWIYTVAWSFYYYPQVRMQCVSKIAGMSVLMGQVYSTCCLSLNVYTNACRRF